MLNRAEMLPTKPRTPDTMTSKETVEKFADVLDQFKPIDGQTSDTELTRIREVLALLLLQIPYDETEGTQNLIGLIRLVAAYTTRYCVEFSKPEYVGSYNEKTDYNATAVVRMRMEAAHKAKPAGHGTYKTARRETAQFTIAVIKDTWVQ